MQEVDKRNIFNPIIMKKTKKNPDLYIKDGVLVGRGEVVASKPKKKKGAQGNVVIPFCKTCSI